MPAAIITAWSVQIDSERASLFDDLLVALDYIRGYIGTNGTGAGTRVVLESRQMDGLRYAAQCEVEDGAGRAAHRNS